MAFKKQQNLEEWAALKVQTAWRGKAGRRRAHAQKEAKMRRWKEMYDEEQKRPFYYNQDTGEIRWRKPQALLDLLSKPVCGNCEYYEARMECGVCNEYFCDDCWSAVHFGGKRKSHKFRALYDFYAKRVDYGDGEWPSIWPSELEQDELIGWHRRQMEDDAAKRKKEDEDARRDAAALGDTTGGWVKYYARRQILAEHNNATVPPCVKMASVFGPLRLATRCR